MPEAGPLTLRRDEPLGRAAVEAIHRGDVAPAREEVARAFWCACHGGQRGAAEFLLDRGAEINWIGYDNLTAWEAARRSGADELAEWLRTRGGHSAREVRSSSR